jgi:hypothetical protein
MRTYSEVLGLARMCAKNARLSTEKGVARELWKMARTKPRQPNSIMAGGLISALRRRRLKTRLSPPNHQKNACPLASRTMKVGLVGANRALCRSHGLGFHIESFERGRNYPRIRPAGRPIPRHPGRPAPEA